MKYNTCFRSERSPREQIDSVKIHEKFAALDDVNKVKSSSDYFSLVRRLGVGSNKNSHVRFSQLLADGLQIPKNVFDLHLLNVRVSKAACMEEFHSIAIRLLANLLAWPVRIT